LTPSSPPRATKPLPAQGRRFFAELIAGKAADGVAFTKKGGGSWGRNHASRPLSDACHAAKIDPPISFHDLRHTYASLLAQAGVDVLKISKLLGHADTRITTRRYAHLSDKALADAVEKLPDFGFRREPRLS
jgi:integrase